MMAEMTLQEAQREWMSDDHYIACKDVSQRRELLEYLAELGFSIGFPFDEYRECLAVFYETDLREVHALKSAEDMYCSDGICIITFEDFMSEDLAFYMDGVNIVASADTEWETNDIASLYGWQ